MTDKSGRELDARVAEVMGIRVQKDQVTRGVWSENKPDDPWEYFIEDLNNRILHYSTDIAAAWEVLERFDNFEISTMKLVEPHCYEVQVLKDGKWFKAHAETFPLAVCRAALKAMEGVG